MRRATCSWSKHQNLLFYVGRNFVVSSEYQTYTLQKYWPVFLLILRCLQGLCSDRHGRKKLSLIGNGIICVSIVLYTVMVGLQYLVHWFSYISIVASFGEFVLGSLKPSECTTKTLLLYINIILGGFFIVKFLPGVPKIMTSKISVIVCCYI